MIRSIGKMTLTFSIEKYKELLVAHVPKLIKTEDENEKALAIVEELMHRERTPEENELYQLLITLIEIFEKENYHFNEPTNIQSLLSFLFEQSGKTIDDLQQYIGSQQLVSDILEAKQNITPEIAQKLGAFFHVKPTLFTET
jgi:HTH-type transcriptional regulator / antitoxin HigA